MGSNVLRLIFEGAVAVLVFVLAFTLARAQMAQAWPDEPQLRIAGWLMVIMLLLWIAIWFVWDLFETSEGPQWLGSIVPPKTGAAALSGAGVAVLIAIVFSLMFLNISHPAIVILLFSLVVLGATIGDSMIISGLRHRDPSLDPTNPIVRYYFERPHLLLHSIQLCFCVAAAVAYHQASESHPPMAVWLGYGILSLSVVVNEAVFLAWRLIRLTQ